MNEVTQILNAVSRGEVQAGDQLLPLVYEELRRLAAVKLALERPGQTLEATALVHEAYLRLVDVEQAQDWNGRGHFFAAAAEAMRRILVDQARRKKREKHGGEFKRVPLFAAAEDHPFVQVSNRRPTIDTILGIIRTITIYDVIKLRQEA